MENLANVLKQRRAELGLTLKQVADAVGVSEATVQRWESGKMNIRYNKVILLAEVLHVDPAFLFGWENLDTKKQPSAGGELSESQKELIDFVSGLPDETCQAILTVLRGQSRPGGQGGR